MKVSPQLLAPRGPCKLPFDVVLVVVRAPLLLRFRDTKGVDGGVGFEGIPGQYDIDFQNSMTINIIYRYTHPEGLRVCTAESS